MNARRGALGWAALVACVAACATGGDTGKGDENLPTSGAGPFRKLDGNEVAGVAPFVLDDKNALYREPAVMHDPGGGGDVILYAIGKQEGRDVVVRSRATDARSFYGTTSDIGHTPPAVLAADQPWEGSDLSGPFAILGAELPSGSGGEPPPAVLLYYAASGGIGAARSSDGLSFTKVPGPILARDPASAWETTELRAPSVYVGDDRRVHLFYASGAAIGEAVSDDGLHFTRAPGNPVLVPAREPAPSELAPNEKPPFDTARVGDPCPSPRHTPAGREQVRVFYTGEGAGGATAIGFAARYGDSGPLERNALPVYSVGQGEAAPAFFGGDGFAYLYVQQERRGVGATATSYPAIAGAYSPGDADLPPPAPFPAGP
jgi:hypothetical protein